MLIACGKPRHRDLLRSNEAYMAKERYMREATNIGSGMAKCQQSGLVVAIFRNVHEQRFGISVEAIMEGVCDGSQSMAAKNPFL